MSFWIRLLVRLHPESFRTRFGRELAEHAGADLERARSRGRIAVVGARLGIIRDLLGSALAERVRPTWPASMHRSVHRHGEGIGMKLNLWVQDIALAVRTLVRSPGFALATIGTLALALGANAAIFAVVDRVLLEPLPFQEPDRLIYIAGSAPGSDLPDEFGLGAEFYLDFRDEASTISEIATFNNFTSTFRTPERVERVSMSTPDVSLFGMLGVEPILGRIPVPDQNEALISYGMWTTWFGQDPSAVGRSYPMLDGLSREIVGVMGEDFGFPTDQTLVWVPNNWTREGIELGQFGLPVIARMADGVNEETVRAELQTIGRRVPENWGGSGRYAEVAGGFIPIVRSATDEFLGDVRGPLWIMMAAVAGVLLIACANIANLFGVRAEGRGRDLAVRRAIGAGRHQLVRSQLSEAVVISGAAGLLAVGLAAVFVPGLVAAVPDRLPRIGTVALTPTVVVFTLLLAVASAVACGLGPALRASRPDLTRLRDGMRGSSRRRTWARDALVVSQTALALILLTGSGLLVRSFQNLYSVDPGYDVEGVFTFQFAPEEAHLTDGPAWSSFHVEMMNRFRALPGVDLVGIVENVPLEEGPRGVRVRTGENRDPDQAILGSATFAGGDYFPAMGIDIVAGRGFTDEDAAIPGNAVISQVLAERLWPGEDPVGRQVESSVLPDGWHTIVGVAEDILQNDLRGDPEPLLYYPLAFENPEGRLTSPGYVIKTDRAETIAPEVRAIIRDAAPSAPMYRMFTMESLIARNTAGLTFTMITIAVAAVLSLLLGAIGLFGVLSYVVGQRTREIGVRIALGAESARVQRMVIAQGVKVVAAGVVLGGLIALVATRALEGLLFGIEAIDPIAFGAAILTMLGVGLVASWLPARRAATIDPIVSMRTE